MKNTSSKKISKTPAQNCLLNILTPSLTNSNLGGGLYSYLINNSYINKSHGIKNIMAFSCPKGWEKR